MPWSNTTVSFSKFRLKLEALLREKGKVDYSFQPSLTSRLLRQDLGGGVDHRQLDVLKSRVRRRWREEGGTVHDKLYERGQQSRARRQEEIEKAEAEKGRGEPCSFRPDISGSWVHVPRDLCDAIEEASKGLGKVLTYQRLLNILDVFYKN